ncbi:hypothetical protein MHB50_20780 [Siminovitchia sp. FSL H7-0308]|uniref:Uncharacterized protein n=1 Tax=Siminovitchia thermophila TaxID=1245522 RepID=A0ABS2R4J6_9BACI|nr:hypothetical protein [Siminovitchia thermophila]MBM7714580.1 hypothetical protein [Siminovitchia thermophila]
MKFHFMGKTAVAEMTGFELLPVITHYGNINHSREQERHSSNEFENLIRM